MCSTTKLETLTIDTLRGRPHRNALLRKRAFCIVLADCPHGYWKRSSWKRTYLKKKPNDDAITPPHDLLLSSSELRHMWHVWWCQPVYACEAVCPVLVAQTFYTDMHMWRGTRPQHICLEKASPIWTRFLLLHNLLVKSSRPAPHAVVSWEIKPVIADRCAFSLHFYDIPHTMVLQEDSHDSVKWIHWRSRTFLII